MNASMYCCCIKPAGDVNSLHLIQVKVFFKKRRRQPVMKNFLFKCFFRLLLVDLERDYSAWAKFSRNLSDYADCPAAIGTGGIL